MTACRGFTPGGINARRVTKTVTSTNLGRIQGLECLHPTRLHQLLCLLESLWPHHRDHPRPLSAQACVFFCLAKQAGPVAPGFVPAQKVIYVNETMIVGQVDHPRFSGERLGRF